MMRNIWFSEWKAMTRQHSYYPLLLLWVIVFSLLFLLEKNNDSISGYTNISGTIVNIILYLLPLFMMIISSFSITNEMENGQWELLSTYPLSIPAYYFGKFTGLFTAQVVVFTFSFGLSIGIGLGVGVNLSLYWLLSIYIFSLLLIFIFLSIGILLGSLAKTRWKALTISIALWFFLILIWPIALITILSLVPYPLIDSLMKLAILFNPAEFLRLFLIIQWDGGAVFGQDYDSLVQLFQSNTGWIILAIYLAAYVLILFTLSVLFLKRRRMQ